MHVATERLTWAEAVFHVLAHTASPDALPSSLHSPRYVRWCAQHLGPADARELGQDAALLAALLDTHAALSAVQVLAWLFRSEARAQACAARSLAELSVVDVDRPALLAPLHAAGQAAELLFCAASLELPRLAQLPPPALDPALAGALDVAGAAAPRLALMRIACVRSLGLCGRVAGDDIWVGAPLDDGLPDAEHCAFQAAHESTVRELSLRPPRPLAERDVERAAIVLFGERCRRAGLAAEHARWYGRLAHAPSLDRATLPSGLRELLE